MYEPINKLISGISRGFSHGQRSPHKFIFLLTLAKICERPGAQNRFFFNSDLESAFEKIWKQYITWLPYNNSLLELPFYYLQSDKIWFLVPKAGYELEVKSFSRLTRNRIIHTIDYGFLDESLFNLFCDRSAREYIVSLIQKKLSFSDHHTLIVTEESPMINTFMSYINSLHSLDGDSDGALAEKQATEKYFCQLHVSHPLVDELYSILTTQSRHTNIILTGHAGDGKSTIALELYKKLKQLDPNIPLEKGLNQREDLNYSGIPISIIKDLSEWDEAAQDRIWNDIKSHKGRFVLVSNTGSLLSLIKRNAENGESILCEEQVLTAMDSPHKGVMEIDGVSFAVYNLALQDNIDLAIQLWKKMCHAPGWNDCNRCPAKATCPILKNVTLIQKYTTTVSERLGLLLRRISAYGNRMTMRQLSAHFSYMLCSGYNCSKIWELATAGIHVYPGDYFFFNHFFGDNAKEVDRRTTQLKAIQIVKAQNFESHLSAGMERYLWLRGQKGSITLNIPELNEYYDTILRSACTEITNQSTWNGLANARARREIRRMFFFLYTPSEDEKATFETFLNAFLNSEMLIQYEAWKKNDDLFFAKQRILQEELFRVLQEYFCGIRIPDGSKPLRQELYITLARKQHNVRQSAQVVLGIVEFSKNFILHLKNGVISLQGRGYYQDINLELSLPFLDYIANRKNGGIGTCLQKSYSDRLEKFKADLLERCRTNDDDRMILLQQGENYELLLRGLQIRHGNLEVSNV